MTPFLTTMNRPSCCSGYMSPEYAMRGHYSIKSDVFSFGVLILEILTGRRSSGSFNIGQSVDLLSFVRHSVIPKLCTQANCVKTNTLTKFAFDTGLGTLDQGNNCGDYGSVSERQSSCRTGAEMCPYRVTLCSG